MNQQNTSEFGTVIFQSRWRRGFSVLQIAVGIGVAVAFSYALLKEDSWFLQLLIAAFVLLGLFAVVHGVRNVINSAVLFAVTNRGVLMFMEGDGVRLASPFFVPWERVESMEYQERRGADGSGDSFTSKTVALKVRTDETWTPAEYLTRNYEKSAGCVHLDAFTGTVRGEELLRRLQGIKAQTQPLLTERKATDEDKPHDFVKVKTNEYK